MTTTPSPGALMEKLKALHAEREQTIAAWRSPTTEFPALFELVVARGMTSEAAGKELGLTGAGVTWKTRPMKAKYAVEYARTGRKRTWKEQREVLDTKVPRPFRELTDQQLLVAVKEEAVNSKTSRRALGARSRKLLDEMSTVIRALAAEGVSAADIAGQLGVSEMTVSRYRRKVT